MTIKNIICVLLTLLTVLFAVSSTVYADGANSSDVCAVNGHTSVIDEAVEPDCTHAGLTEGSHCAVCGETIVPQAMIPALGHKPVDYPSYVESCYYPFYVGGKFCMVCGEVLEERHLVGPLGHVEQTVAGYPATRLHSGLTDGVRCGRCGAWIKEQQAIPRLGGNVYRGDTNGDGAVDILDATVIQRFLAGLSISDAVLAGYCGDADEDGEVTVLDATRIQRYLAGYAVGKGIGEILKLPE